MYILTRYLKISVFLLVLLPCQYVFSVSTSSSEDPFVLIINADSPVKSLSKKELRSLFSLRRSVWADGSNVRLVTMPEGHATHKKFIEQQLKLFPYQVKRIWDRQIFSGSAVRPISVNSSLEIIDMVAKTRGAIGYCPSSEIKAIKNEQVKIISIN